MVQMNRLNCAISESKRTSLVASELNYPLTNGAVCILCLKVKLDIDLDPNTLK